MTLLRHRRWTLAAAAAALAATAWCVAASGPDAHAAPRRARRAPPVLPAWSVVGNHVLDVDVGVVDLTGQYTFTLAAEPGSASLTYEAGRIRGGGSVGLTFFGLKGTTSLDEADVQHAAISDDPRVPTFRFDATVAPTGIDLEGTATAAAGFAGLAEAFDGPVTFRRVARTAPARTFRLTLPLTMDRKGVVRGLRDDGGRERRATLRLFGSKVLEGGVVRGKVVTSADGLSTTANLKVRGKGWTVVLDGPVDADGFHAAADIRAAGFVFDDRGLTVPVGPGPEPPPPPPPPPPANLLAGATARIVGNQITVTRRNVTQKFWKSLGRGTDLTVEFPGSILGAPGETLVADSGSAGGASPVRFAAAIGRTNWGAFGPGGSMTLKIPRGSDGNLIFSTTPGQSLRVLCQGTIADAGGRTRTVDVLLEARVEP